MSELACLEVAVLLWLVHLLLQANLTGASPAYLFSPRDEPPPPLSLTGGRAARAFRNYMESFAVLRRSTSPFSRPTIQRESGRPCGSPLA